MNYKAYRQTLADLISAENRVWNRGDSEWHTGHDVCAADELHQKRGDLKQAHCRRYKTVIDGRDVHATMLQYDWGFSLVNIGGRVVGDALFLRMENGAYTHEQTPTDGSQASAFLRKAAQAARDWVDGKIEELPLAISEA